MILNMLKLFGPGVTDILKIMWSADTGGDGGGASGGTDTGGEAVSASETVDNNISAEITNPSPDTSGLAGQVETLRNEVGGAIEKLAELYRDRGDLIPELVTGNTVKELEDNVERAVAAFNNIKAKLTPPAAPPAAPPIPPLEGGSGVQKTALDGGPKFQIGSETPVGAGGGVRGGTGAEAPVLSALDKIALGISAGNQR